MCVVDGCRLSPRAEILEVAPLNDESLTQEDATRVNPKFISLRARFCFRKADKALTPLPALTRDFHPPFKFTRAAFTLATAYDQEEGRKMTGAPKDAFDSPSPFVCEFIRRNCILKARNALLLVHLARLW